MKPFRVRHRTGRKREVARTSGSSAWQMATIFLPSSSHRGRAGLGFFVAICVEDDARMVAVAAQHVAQGRSLVPLVEVEMNKPYF